MRSTFFRRSIAFVALAALFTVALAASRPPARGVTYRLRMSTKLPEFMAQMGGDAGGPTIIARAKTVGKRARLDFLSPAPGMNADDYVLILDSTQAVFVNPEQKSYADASALVASGGGLGALGSMAGGGRGRGGRGGGAPAVDITGIVTDLEQLDGDTLDGRQVKHYRIVAEMNVAVMNQMAPLRIVMEIYTANLSQKIINPFDLTGTVSPNDPAPKLTAKLLELRKKIDGTPVKTVTTLILTGLMGGAAPPMEFVTTMAITDIKDAEVDVKDLEIPAGFAKKGGP